MNQDAASVPRHPIGVVAERTGLSQDVLRVWERRYAAVSPGRGPGGQRAYSDRDVERLRLLALATSGGRTIGQIAAMSTDQIRALVDEDASSRGAATRRTGRGGPDIAGAIVDESLERTRALDAMSLERVLRRAVTLLGIHPFLESVAAPLLRQIGDEWHAGRLNPAQEHLASAIVHRVIVMAMQALPLPPDAPHVVISTPLGERHELGAILAAASAAGEGWGVTYLGSDLPAAEIANAALATRADAVAVSTVYPTDERTLLGELRALRGRLPSAVSMLVGGVGAAGMAGELAGAGVDVVATLPDFRERLRALSRRQPV